MLLTDVECLLEDLDDAIAAMLRVFGDHIQHNELANAVAVFLDREETRRRAQQELLLREDLIRELQVLGDLQLG